MVIVDANIVAKTKRLLLRALASSDAQDVLLMHREAEVMKHTSLLPSSSLAKTQAWIQGCFDSPNNWNFAIELLAPDSASHSDDDDDAAAAAAAATTTTTTAVPRVIGLIGAVRAPEIGYMLHPSVWGRGYATEALQAFLPLFFAHCDCPPPTASPVALQLSSSPCPHTTATATGKPTDTISLRPSPRRFAYAEAHTDPAHLASHAVLRKAGFTVVEQRERDFHSPILGWRDTMVWRVGSVDEAEMERVTA